MRRGKGKWPRNWLCSIPLLQADRMIDMGFEPEVKKILEYLPGVFCTITVLCVERHIWAWFMDWLSPSKCGQCQLVSNKLFSKL